MIGIGGADSPSKPWFLDMHYWGDDYGDWQDLAEVGCKDSTMEGGNSALALS
jgi:hypothetical protein